MRTAHLCLLTVVLMLSGCSTLSPQSPQQTRPLLDRSLAQPCPPLPAIPAADYDAWLEWMVESAGLWACWAVKHRGLVEAWPR